MSKYYVDRSYGYNTFGADEHLIITLYKDNGGKKLKYVDSWSYSTYFSPKMANRRGTLRFALYGKHTEQNYSNY